MLATFSLCCICVASQCVAVESNSKTAPKEKQDVVLFKLADVPSKRHEDYHTFFEECFGKHVEKGGRIEKDRVGDVLIEWHDYAIDKRGREFLPSKIRIHSFGGIRWKGESEFDDRGTSLRTIEYTITVPKTISVAAAKVLVAKQLGIEELAGDDAKSSQKQLLVKRLEPEDSRVSFSVPEAGHIRLMKGGSSNRGNDTSGLRIRVRILVWSEIVNNMFNFDFKYD